MLPVIIAVGAPSTWIATLVLFTTSSVFISSVLCVRTTVVGPPAKSSDISAEKLNTVDSTTGAVSV